MGAVRESSLSFHDQSPSPFRFMTVGEMALRYVDIGSGRPVILLHGNGSMIEDFLSSGIMEHAPPGHRLVAFDRPGFGYSERPAYRSWGPFEQASLFLRAIAQLGIERPIVVGHSWGTLVALAMALKCPEEVAGLVLMSGYYYPVPAKAIAAPTVLPLAGDVLRHTVGLFVRRLMAPETLRRVFAPCAVPERFRQTYPLALAMRTSQMLAVDEEAAMLLGATKILRRHYRELHVPVHLIAGSDDRIVDTEAHSARLHEELATSTFHRLPGCGHMVHHAAPDAVVAAIEEIGRMRGMGPDPWARTNALQRQWLHIGENLVAA
jgi:pimeloyl-ACP methyl ester carboxylesterase